MRFPGFPDNVTRPLMKPEGTGRNGVLVVGESLGESEEKDCLPFRPYAEAGSILARALYRAGVQREDLTLTNLVWYRPPRNWLDGAPWEDGAIQACKPMNDALVRDRQPRCILALGGMAMRELTGLSGEKCGIGMTRGFVVPGVQYQGIPVVGSYHPSFLRRGSKEREDSGPRGRVEAAGGGTQGMALLGVLIRDILLAVQTAREGARRFEYDDYRMGASLADWQRLLQHLSEHSDLPISYDFETLDSIVASDESEFEITRRDVTQVQVSYRPGQAVVSDWFPEVRPILKQILELPNPKLDWNGRKFDRPILREMGIRTDLGEWHDLMDFWHHSQPDLARGLQFATSFHCPEVGPWKHLSASDPHWYGALDVDMPQRIWEGLRLSCAQTRHPISGISLCTGYQDQVVRLAPVLDRMSARGIPVDDQRRLELDKEFTATLERLESEMQGMFPEEIKNVTPKHGYVRTPPEMLRDCESCGGDREGRIRAEVVGKNGKIRVKKIICPECHGVGKFTRAVVPDGWVEREFEDELKCGCGWSKSGKLVLDAFGNPGVLMLTALDDCARCQNTGKVLASVTRWARVEPFLPGSWQQVLRYIEYMRDRDVAERSAQYIERHPTMASLAPAWAREKSPWKVPVDHKTGKPTTAEAELARLAKRTEDKLLPMVLEHREIAKARGTYVRGWAPQDIQDIHTPGCPSHWPQMCTCGHNESFHHFACSNIDCVCQEFQDAKLCTCVVQRIGRVHPNFGFKPATPQLSSDSPNAQNFYAHGEIAHRMKQMIVARPGYRMVKFDWKSFFIITGGFEAQDAPFIRIGRVDMHSFVTLVGLLKLERPEVAFGWSSAELKERLGWYRKSDTLYPEYARGGFPAGMTFGQIRDYIAKRVIFAWQNGQGPRSLWYLWQETFKDITEAATCQRELAQLFPKTPAWQAEVRLRADVDHQLVTRFGHVRRFWDVYHRRPVAENYQPRGEERVWTHRDGQRWLLVPGDDHEAVTAYLPNANAYGIKRRTLVEIGERGWDERYGLLADVHDALYFECLNERLDNLLSDVKPLMEAKCPILTDPVTAPDGLWCEVEAEWSQDWDHWEKIRVGVNV